MHQQVDSYGKSKASEMDYRLQRIINKVRNKSSQAAKDADIDYATYISKYEQSADAIRSLEEHFQTKKASANFKDPAQRWGANTLNKMKYRNENVGDFQEMSLKIDEIDRNFKHVLSQPLKDVRKKVEAFSVLNKASDLATSTSGTTSTLRGISNPYAMTLRTIGHMMPSKKGGEFFGNLGYAAGQYLASPAAKRDIMTSGRGLSEILEQQGKAFAPKSSKARKVLQNITPSAAQASRVAEKIFESKKREGKQESDLQQKGVDNLYELLK
jgi:hypothetical protein